MALKILLIYPNYRGMNMLPPAIGLLSAVLKRAGYTVELFDTTYYQYIDREERVDSDGSKADRLMARPVSDMREITLRTTDVYDDFQAKIDSFSPDLLALSCTEDMWHLGLNLLKHINKPGRHILTIVGGVFPTFAPHIVLGHEEVDIVCKGEGEDALLELCKRIENKRPFHDIPNLWIKNKDGGITANPIQMIDMDKNPLIDMSIFEEARFYRPMGGRVWRMFPVETFRGCPYMCAYCNSPAQMGMYKKELSKTYLRRKSFENMRRELLFYKNEMKAEYLYFWADTFFSWGPNEFEEFAEMYEEIALPFWCQTRIETVTREKFERLKEIGCARISFGLEHGNEKFRREKLHRQVSNQTMLEKFKIVNEVGIPYSVNNIMGFPHETRALAFDTIEFNREIDATDRNAYMFTPFSGTSLRAECEHLGFLKPTDIVRSMVADGSLLDMPQFPRKEVQGIVKTFNMYVKFPKSRWQDIRLAESDSAEGQRAFEALKQEFVEKYWEQTDSFESASKAHTPDPRQNL